MFRYTDGITEATDTDENMSREERMLKALNKDITASVEDIDADVLSAVMDFVKNALQSDDPTKKIPSVRIHRIILYKGQKSGYRDLPPHHNII